MHEPHSSRRVILKFLVVMVMASAALGSGQGASAGNTVPAPPYNSAASFKTYCEAGEGKFTPEIEGNNKTSCKWPNKGGTTDCDANGKNCTWTSFAPVPDDEGPLDETLVDPLAPVVQDGTGSPSPGVDSPTAAPEASSLTAPSDDHPAKAKHGKGKKHKHGKGRRK
jgi:hypothetical protein